MIKKAYKDQREWIDQLEKVGQLARIKRQVDWKYELGMVLRRNWDVYGDAAPALLFENIKDYAQPKPNKVFVSQFSSLYRIAMAFGCDPASVTRVDLVKRLRELINDRSRHLPPRVVETGPVKENIIAGDEIDLLKFPVPQWNHRDGGRFIGMMHSVITKDPDSGWMNVGCYRMMVHSRDECGMQIDPANQHIGEHYYKNIERSKPMEVAVVIGQEPALTYMACCPTADPISEYDIAGAMRGEPIDVVKCETIDLYVPATAEIVLEGTIHPKERKLEGPCGEVAGYYGSVPGPKPVFRVKAITHRNDPVFTGTMEGYPVDEDHASLCIAHSAYAWDVLEKASIRGVKGVAMPLDACGFAHCVVSIRPLIEGHADTVASALWASKAGLWAFKHVIVVDEDIDPWNSEQVNWSIAWRVKASEDVKIWKNHRGSRLDPRVPPEEKGFQDKMLIDATRPYHWAPRDIWATEGVRKGIPLKFPPTTRPQTETALKVNSQWEEYGIKPTKEYIGKAEGMMKHWWNDEEIKKVMKLEVMP